MSTDYWGNNPQFRANREKIDLSTLQGNLVHLKYGSYFGGSLIVEFEDGTPYNDYAPAAMNVALTNNAADYIYDALRLDFIPEEQLYVTYQYLTNDVVNDPTILVEAAKTTENIDSPLYYSDLKDVPEELANELRDVESVTVDGTEELNLVLTRIKELVEQIYITKAEVDPYILETLNVSSYQTIVEATLLTTAKEIVPAINELDTLMRRTGSKSGALLAFGGTIRGNVDLNTSTPERNTIWEVETNARVTADFISGADYVDVQLNDFIIYDVSEEGFKHLDFGRLINRLAVEVNDLKALIAKKQNIVDNNLATISKITVSSINELYQSVINIEVPTLSFKDILTADGSIANQCSGASKHWVVNIDSDSPIRVEAKWEDGVYNKEVLNGDTILYERISGHCRIVSDHVLELRQLEETYQQTVSSLPKKANVTQPSLKTTDKTIVGAINEILELLVSKETIGPSLGLDASVGYYDQSTINVSNELDYIYPVQPVMVDALREFKDNDVAFPNGTTKTVTNRSIVLKGTKTSPDLNLVIDPYKNTKQLAVTVANLKPLSEYVSPSYLSGSLIDGLAVFKTQQDGINDTTYHLASPVGLPAGKTFLQTLTELNTAVRGKLVSRNVPMITPLCDLKPLFDLHGEGVVCEYKDHIYILDSSDPLAVELKVYLIDPDNYKKFTLVATKVILSSVAGDVKMTHNGTELVIASSRATLTDGSSSGLVFTVVDMTTLQFINYKAGNDLVNGDANLSTAICLANGTIHYGFKYTHSGVAKLEMGKLTIVSGTISRKVTEVGLKHINDVLVTAKYINNKLLLTLNGTGVDNALGTCEIVDLVPVSPILKGLDNVINGEVFAATDYKRTVIGDSSNLWIYVDSNLHAPTAIIPNSLFDGLVPHMACDGIYPMIVMRKSNDANARVLCAITEA